MGTLSAIIIAFAGLLGAAFAKILADEFKAWCPAMLASIVALAVRILPQHERDRYSEEWSDYLAEVPGDLGKIVTAFGFVLAAGRMVSLPVRIGKRSLDVAVALFAVVVLSPLLLLASLSIKLDSPGPLIFRQRRIGMNGKKFAIYKLRTMVTEGKRDDAHVTRVGALLRRTGIDEIPQMFNVLRGDMGFFGRPPLREHEVNESAGTDVMSDRPGFAPNLRSFVRIIWEILKRGAY